MKELNETEKRNALSIFNAHFNVHLNKLKENYFELLKEHFAGTDYTLEDKKVLDKYLNKDILIFEDSNFFDLWFILEDNNYVLPKKCFEL